MHAGPRGPRQYRTWRPLAGLDRSIWGRSAAESRTVRWLVLRAADGHMGRSVNRWQDLRRDRLDRPDR